jgi:predicted CXXCH cytochrome family protein
MNHEHTPKGAAVGTSRIIIILAVACLILAHPFPAAGAPPRDEEMGKRCFVCHITASPEIKAGEETFYVSTGFEREQGSADMCYSCHNGSVMDSRKTAWTGHQHPTDTTPKPETRVPGDFPLAKGNKLFCGTCHSPHEEPLEIEGRRTTNLRRPRRTGDFCMECHVSQKKGGHSMGKLDSLIPLEITLAGGHSGSGRDRMTCRTCHLPHGSPEKDLLVRARETICEDCHGGNPSKEGKGAGMDSHPVGVKIAAEVLAKEPPGGIEMVTGRKKEVICLTCHKTHAPQEKKSLLAMSDPTGEFCVHCHTGRGGGGSKKGNNGNHPHIEEKKRGRVEIKGCNTCHRPHNGARDHLADSGRSHLLSAPMDNSELCIQCHEDLGAFETDEARFKGTHPLGEWAEKRSSIFFEDDSEIKKEKISCRSCHLSHNTEPGFSSLKEHRTFFCLNCHPDQNSLNQSTSATGNHPVYVSSDRSIISQELLLAGGLAGEYGEIVCQTCHTVHRAEKNTPLLIEPATRKDYCTQCHPAESLLLGTKHDLGVSSPDTLNKFAESPAESGACGACHRTHGWTRNTDQGSDPIRQMCLDCHFEDSSIAGSPGHFGHPTGVGMGERGNLLGLPLFNEDGERDLSGDISCSTCHEVHRETIPRLPVWVDGELQNTEGHFLRLPFRKTNLICLGCHQEYSTVKDSPHDSRRAKKVALPSRPEAPESKEEARNRARKEIGGEPDIKTEAQAERIAGDGPCDYCHSPHKGGGPMMWARKIEAADDGVSPLCVSCHSPGREGGKKVPKIAHPTGVSIPLGMDTSLPLFDSDGRRAQFGLMTCGTCHDVHRKGSYIASGKDGEPASDRFLRIKPGQDKDRGEQDAFALCVHCHDEKQSVLGTTHDLHKGTCGGCHAPHPDSAELMWSTELWDSTDSPDPDPATVACLKCHEKIPRERNPEGEMHGHPVGLSSEAAASEGLPLFDNLGRKNPRGTMSCATCHDTHAESSSGASSPTSDGKKETFQRMEGKGRICLVCHPKKENIVGTAHDPARLFPAADQSDACGACHSTHSGGDGTALWAGEYGKGEDLTTRHCLGCHSESGSAKDKIPEHMTHPKAMVAIRGAEAEKLRQDSKSFGNILKDVLVGEVEPSRGNLTIYMAKPMTMIDRAVIGKNSPPLVPLYDENSRPGPSGILSCPSCHDIHNSEAKIHEAVIKDDAERERVEKNLIRTSYVDEATKLCADCHGPHKLSVFWGFHGEARGKNYPTRSPNPRSGRGLPRKFSAPSSSKR